MKFLTLFVLVDFLLVSFQSPILREKQPDKIDCQNYGTIAYVAKEEGKANIFSVAVDSLTTLPITDNDSYNLAPSWSPDGSKIAFESNQDGNWEIFSANADGTDLQNVTRNDADDRYPQWSPIDSEIAFLSMRNEKQVIFISDEVGSNLSKISPDDIDNYIPTWSPDGSYIAFASDENTPRELVLFDTYQENTIRFSEINYVSALSWSPDSQKVVVQTDYDGIYSFDVLNGNIVNLASVQTNGYEPQWSPIGDNILYWTTHLGRAEIHSVSSDGKTTLNLIQTSMDGFGGVWSPDGDAIAFVSDQDGTEDLYVMDSMGKNVRKVASSILDFSYAWQPCQPQ